MGEPASRKYWRRAAIALSAVAILLLVGRLVLRSKWMHNVVLSKLRTVVGKAVGPSYSVGFGKVEVDPIGGGLAITDLVLEPDTILFSRLRQAQERFVLSVHLGRISISGLSYWRLILEDEVRVASAHVYAPTVRYTYASRRKAQVADSMDTHATEGALSLLSIGELVVTDAKGKAVDLMGRAPELQLGRSDARAHRIRVTLPKEDAAAEWEVERAQVDIREVMAQLPPLYDLSIAHIGLIHPEGLATIDTVRYTPRVKRTTTHSFLREMTTIYGLDVNSITLARVDLVRAFAEQRVAVGNLTVDGVFFDVFLDKSMPDAPSRAMPLPVTALRNVPFDLRVDTLRLTNATMEYAERFEVENGYGSMRLTDIEVTLFNVANDTLLALADSSMRATVDAELFGKGKLHGDYAAPLASLNDAFTLDVTLRSMPLAAANSMAENLLLLRADSGWISSLDLHMRANHDSAIGSFALKYNDAWLRILDSEGGKRGFLTGLVNKALRNNTKEDPVADRTLQLRLARRKDRSLFNFIWIYTREGLMYTLLPGVLADVQGGMMKRKARAQRSEGKRKGHR